MTEYKKTRDISIRFPPELAARLHAVAAEEYRSLNGLVLLACETWVTQWEIKHPVRTSRGPVKVGHAPGPKKPVGKAVVPTPRRQVAKAR